MDYSINAEILFKRASKYPNKKTLQEIEPCLYELLKEAKLLVDVEFYFKPFGPLSLCPKEIIEITKKYKYKRLFKKENRHIYEQIKRQGNELDYYRHMLDSPPWTKKKILNAAKCSDNLNVMRSNSPGAYYAAREKGYIDQLIFRKGDYYKNKHPQRVKWNVFSLYHEAKKYKSLRAFKNKSTSAYLAVKRAKLDICLEHMTTQKNKYNLLNVKKIAKQFKTKSAFLKYEPNFYRAAKRYGWLNELF